MRHTQREQGDAPDTLISRKIQEAAHVKGMTLVDLAKSVGDGTGSYENMRRVFKGISVPSAYLLRNICDVLDLPRPEMERLAKADKIRLKFGTVPLELSGKKPSLEPVDRVWDDLTPEQQGAVVNMVQAWSKQNRIRT